MKFDIKVVTPPVNYPVDLEDMANMLRIDTSAPGAGRDLALIEDLIGAATSILEKHTGRAFITQTLKMILMPDVVARPTPAGIAWGFESMHDRIINIWRPPCQSFTSVSAIDEAGVAHVQAPETYVVNLDTQPATLQLRTGASWEFYNRGYYVLQYVAGYGATLDKVPPEARHAVRVTVAQWWAAKENIDYTIPPQAADLVADLRLSLEDL